MTVFGVDAAIIRHRHVTLHLIEQSIQRKQEFKRPFGGHAVGAACDELKDELNKSFIRKTIGEPMDKSGQ
jgi:hypothetical protein